MVRAKQTDGKTAIRKAEKRAKQAEKANRKALKQADCDEVGELTDEPQYLLS